ncbi:MAG: ABC transporter ATP-binding protein [Dehalococcoidia bacterium]|jgi:heme exporter protein A|nr:ABC transporter ATP-binding protein [Dehalococcoidia bacterium]
MIEARALTKRFGGVIALDGVSFRLARGSRTALLGANAAGKSTLLSLLSTLATPTSGEARIDGFDVAAAPPALRRRLGVMTHLPMVYEELSAEENLSLFARLYEVRDAASRIEELLRTVGLWLRRDEPAAVLSRGAHQRLAIARALIHRPDVLLFDEPETGLDEQGLVMLDELTLGGADAELTVLAATHRRDRVGSWADGTIVLERGRVVEDTTAPGTTSAEPADEPSTGDARAASLRVVQ